MSRVRQHQNGYVFLKGSSWYLRYRRYEIDSSGNERLVQRCHKLADNKGKYRSKRAVKTLSDEFLAPLNSGTLTSASNMSVVEFWGQEYFPYITAYCKPSTVNGYRNMWTLYLKERLMLPLRDFRTVNCERLLQRIALEHNLSVATLKHVKHLLSGIFRYAIRTGALNGVNPVQAACIPRSRTGSETHAYSLEQIQKMLDVLPHPAKAVVAVAAFAGLRKGELRGLRPGDYDGESLKIKQAAWRRYMTEPKGKRGLGQCPSFRLPLVCLMHISHQ
jgi:hypothetical protein